MLPRKKSSSVKIDRAAAPTDSYSFAFSTGLKFSEITPALGEAFFISAMMASSLLEMLLLKLLFGLMKHYLLLR